MPKVFLGGLTLAEPQVYGDRYHDIVGNEMSQKSIAIFGAPSILGVRPNTA